MNSSLLRSALVVASCGCIIAVHAQEKTLKLKQTIPLPGVEGRIDHFALDASGERLFVCALGNNTVEVLDLRKGERIRSITGLGAPQGIVYIPELDRLFVANDKAGIFKIYDGKSFQQISELNFEEDADNVRYEDTMRRIYVGFGSGGIAIVNAQDGKQIGSIKLSAHPEGGQCGWTKDRYGLSWQITPKVLNELLGGSDEKRRARVTQAFLKMKKFDIAALKRASE